MNRTNAINCINADKKINIFQRLTWLCVNYINNIIFPNKSNLLIKQFIPNLSEENWNRIDKIDSPSRVLSDLFWMNINWTEVKKELAEINLLDTGCGDGNYFHKLNTFSHSYINKYCGIDIEKKDNWDHLKEDYSNVDFKIVNSDSLIEYIPNDLNLFISQSAIEHFEEDLVYFQQIKDFIDTTKNDVIQIHLFPAASCLTQYIWHGIRQYTPRTIEKITKIFDNTKSYSVLYKLGGNLSNKLHKEFITFPVYFKNEDYRYVKKDEYAKQLKFSIENDKNGDCPSFYALIIHSNYKNKIFENMQSLD